MFSHNFHPPHAIITPMKGIGLRKNVMGGHNQHSALCSSTKTMIVLMVAITIGYISGQIIKSNSENSYAASGNVIVSNNNQIVTHEQGSGAMKRTSTVTVRDSTANYGYTLRARISQNSLPAGSTVKIGNVASMLCPENDPCTLNSGIFVNVMETTNSNAMRDQGESTDWKVMVALPANAELKNYIVDIEYDEERVPIDPMQSFTVVQCATLTPGQTVRLVDLRDNTVYRVRKMADNRCWMVDNLALDLTAAYLNGQTKPNWSVPPVKLQNGGANTDTVPQLIENNNTVGEGQIPNYVTPKASYLYNYCATMADTTNGCTTTLGYGDGQPTAVQTGICPGEFKVPRGGAGMDFAALDLAMGGTGVSRLDTMFQNNTWMATADVSFIPVFSGYFRNGSINERGSSGFWRTSTAMGSSSAYVLGLYSSGFMGLGDWISNKLDGIAVRCVI